MKATNGNSNPVWPNQHLWQDPQGVMHAATGDRIVPNDAGTYCVWTKCGSHDVPANASFISTEQVTCPKCKEES